MLKIYPPLLACVTFSARSLGWSFGLFLILCIVLDYLKGRPFMGLQELLHASAVLGAVFLAFCVALALLLYLVMRASAWSIGPIGLVGRNYWGSRSAIAWSDIGGFGLTSLAGVPALVITSATSAKEIYAFVLGVSTTEIYARLQRYAGVNHALTQFFDSSAA